MNGHPIEESTPFHQLLDERTPRATFNKTEKAPYKLPYVNPMYEIFNPRDLTDYSP